MTDDRELWISERAAIREYMGGQDRAAAERAAVRDWELWCAERKLDVATGMPMRATETAQGSVQA